MRCGGRSEIKIAEELGITQQGVSKILTRMSTRYLKANSDMVARQLAEQTMILQYTLEESIAAWERSKQDANSKLASKTSNAKFGDTTYQSLKTTELYGDPRFLESIRETLADLREIWGVNAPKKLAIQDMDAMIERELARLAAEEQQPAEVDGDVVM